MRHPRSGSSGRHRIRTAIAVLAATVTMTGTTLAVGIAASAPASATTQNATPAASPAASGNSGTVTGEAFRDYNANGQMDTAVTTTTATDIGVAGVTVTAYDSTNAVVGTTTTAADGSYTLNFANSASTQVRVQFSVPSYLNVGPEGTGSTGVQSGGQVQFVSSGGTANLGLVAPGDYCGANPTITVPCQQQALTQGGGTQTPSTAAALFTLSSTANGDSPGQVTAATIGQIGSVSGNAVYTSPNGTEYDMTSAYFKYGTNLGPAGLGGIYLTQLGTGTANASTFTTVANVGTDPRPTENPASTTYSWFHDIDGFADVGRIGLGQLMLSADQKTLYATDLYNNTIVAIPLTAPATVGGAPTPGTPTVVNLPTSLPGATQACPNTTSSQANYDPSFPANLHAFGLGQYDGVLYAALTCTGPSVSSLRSYVYAMNESTNAFATTPSIEIPLTFSRGCTAVNVDNCGQNVANVPARSAGGSASSAAWNPWVDTTTTGFALSQLESTQTANGGTILADPMPDLATISFTSNGSMQLAFHDRLADMSGELQGDPTTTTGTAEYNGRGGGDILLACGSPSSGWTLESDGSCGGAAGSGVGNLAGPGGGEFYVHYFNGANTSDSGQTSHQQTASGSALQIPGFADVITTDFDPTDHYGSGGLRVEADANGANVSGAQLYYSTGGTSTFAKASGLGAIASLCGTPPVEIGDRVWIDAPDTGIQDAGETPVAGATVTLSTLSGTLLATTTTNANGVYTFSSTTTPALTASTQYVVAVDKASDFAAGGPLATAVPSPANAGTDPTVNSKGIANTGTGAVGSTYTVTSPAVGANLNADFGFVIPGSLTGTAYVDTNLNGSYDPGETPVSGVTATLETLTGGAVTDVNGNTVPAVKTSASGAYSFTDLVPGNYQVVFSTIPAGDVLVDPSNGTSPSTAVPAGGSGVANVGVTAAPGSIDGTEYVDANLDKAFDTGDSPVTGSITVTLTNSGGTAVQGTNAQPIAPITTTNGTYDFVDVPPGSGYTVTFTEPNGDSFVSPAGGVSGPLAVTTNNTTVQNQGVTAAPGTISGEEYVDSNLNKTLDPGEPAVTSSITVTLTNGGKAVTGTDGNTIAPVTTSSGSYSFADVPPASGYVVTFTKPTADSFVSPTAGISSPLTVTTKTNTVQNQGVTAAPGTISGEEYVDTNRNGTLDSGEPAVTGSITVTLTNGGKAVTGTDGNPIVAVTTTNGTYSFANVPPGSGYVVTFTEPSGDTFVSPAGGVSGSLSVTTGAATTQNQGVTAAPGTITGEEYVDTNLDKMLDTGDTAVTSSVTATLTLNGASVIGTNGVTIAPVTTTNGTYTFVDVPPGTGYVVTLTKPAADTFVNPATGVSPALTVTTGATTTSNQGVTTAPGTISGTEYVDANLDQTFDAGDSAVTSSVTVTLTNGGKAVTGTDGNPIGAVTTTNGTYSFADVPPGTGYVVTFTEPSGDTFVNPSTGVSGQLTVNTNANTVQNQGVTAAPNTISGEEYVDTNRNGTLDSGEPAVTSGITVTLQRNGASVQGTNGVAIAPVTTSTGSYSFADVPPATGYTVTFTEPNGDVFVNPASGTTAAFTVPTSGGVVMNAGVTAAPGTIAGTEYVDTNLDGSKDNGETGVTQQVTVTLTDSSGHPVVGTNGVAIGAITVTNGQGTYQFNDVPPGSGYLVTFTDPSGDVFVTPSTGTSPGLTVTSSTTTTQNQGVTTAPGTVSGTEYVDTNRDGTQDSGETGVTGSITVTLKNSSGNQVQGTNAQPILPVTTTNGSYSFADVPPGTGYTVTFTEPTGDSFVVPAGGISPALTVTSGANTLASQGVTASPGTITGEEYVDANRNKQLDNGESGVSGITVRLRDASNNPVVGTNGVAIADQTTTAAGTYSFVDVPPGTGYVVSFTDPTGDTFVNPANGITSGVAVTSNTTTANVNQGVTAGPGTIAGEEYVDTNRNGALDSGEPVVGSTITVTLKNSSGGQVTGTDGNPILPISTTGTYSFANVPPGTNYTVTFTSPSGDTFVNPASGTSPALTVTTGATTTANQGVTPGPGTVSGTEYVDTNLDGKLDGSEVPYTGAAVTYRLRDANNNPVVSTTGATIASITNSTGTFSFANVPPGTGYTVTFTDPAGEVFVIPAGGISSALTVTSGATTVTNQGITATPGTITGTEYTDTNLDGTQDNGETGVAGLTVTLTNNGQPVQGSNAQPVPAATTGANGTYTFADVPPASGYTVTFTDPTGDVFVNPAGGISPALTVTSGATVTQNQGVTTAPATISGEIYNDNNLDKTLDAGDTAVTSSVTVTLTNGGKAVVGTNGQTIQPVTTTNGLYSFPTVPAGSGYVVTFSQPTGDSFVNPTTGVSPALTAASGATVTQNQGVTPAPSTISGTEYVDTNRNGTLDTGEPAVTTPITVTLTQNGNPVTGSDGNPIQPITTSNGTYDFTEVPPAATYTVTFGLPQGTGAQPPAGDSFVVPAGGTATVTLGASGGVVQNQGVTATPGTISGEEYHDNDLSGTLDSGDTPVAGLTVTLTLNGQPVQGTNAQPVPPATTTANGTYTFLDVPPGTGYTVTFTAPTGDSFVVPAGGTATGVAVTSGAATAAVNAGVTPTPGSISGLEYVDTNLSSSYQPGDPPVTSSVTVTLENSSGGAVTGTAGTVLQPITTMTGSYQFTDVPPGSGYTVSFSLPTGDTYVSPASGTSAPQTVTSGADTPNVDQGVTAAPGTIAGTEFVDTNRNGVPDPGELGVPGYTVTLTTTGGATVTGTNGQVIMPTTTGTDGTYRFADVPPGTYDVDFTLPNGDVYTPPTAPTGVVPVMVTTGNGAEADAGVTPAPETISGEEYTDVDLSGSLTTGDTPVGSQTVTLTNADGSAVTGTNGQPIGSVTTDATTGDYTFADVPPGSGYVVTFTAPTGDSFVTPATGAVTAVTVNPGTPTTAVDAGVTATPGTLSGEEYIDTNRNGAPDAGEPAVTSGVIVTLENGGAQVQGANGQPIPPITTDTGSYQFTEVPPGSGYTVTFSLPTGYSYVNPATGISAAQTVTSATDTPNVDQGVTASPGTISGTEFVDSNYDGMFDGNETGQAGDTVRLRDADNNPVVGTNGTTIANATTGANGTYTFTDVPPGTGYKVIFSAPAGDIFTAPAGTTANGIASPLTVTSGGTTTQDQGVVPAPGTVTGEEYTDSNDNGQLDAGEAPVTGSTVTVTLTDGSGNPVTGTDGNVIGPVMTTTGTYTFANVPAGSYRVAFTDPAGDTFVNPATGTDTGVTVTSGGSTTADAGVTLRPGTIAGTEYVDTNLDRMLDDGETGITGPQVTVTLRDANNQPVNSTLGTAIPAQTTVNGAYSFADVPVGSGYVVTFTDPAGDVFVSPTGGVSGALSVASDQTVIQDQGVIPAPGTITGEEYGDTNRNGMLDTDESAVTTTTPLTVTLEDAMGNPVTGTDGNTIAPVDTTDGTYTFTDVPVGSGYQVVFTDPSGDSFVSPALGDATGVTVTSGTATTVDAGVTASPGTISGVEYVDADLNQTYDNPPDTLVPSFTAALVDGSGNEVVGTDGQLIAPVTGVDGAYSFADVPPGTGYVVSFTAPTGDSFVSPTGGVSGPLTVTTGNDTVQDQGVTTTPGSITGTLYDDTGLTGTYVSSDPLVDSAVTVTLTFDGQPVTGTDGNPIPPVVTTTGTYTFANVPAGTDYVVSFSDPDGDTYVSPAGTSGPLTVTTDQATTQNEGYTAAPGTISGTEYLDENRDGSTDNTDPPVGSAVTVTLSGPNGTVTGTNAQPIMSIDSTDGTYAFTDVPPGSGYTVTFTAASGDVFVNPADGSTDDLTVVTGGTTEADQGVTPAPVHLSGTEYVDTNRDGTLDGPDAPVGTPVTVTLTDANGHQVIGTDGKPIETIDSADGTYDFTTVPPGTGYQLTFTAPNGDVFVSPVGGVATGIDLTTGAPVVVDAGVTAAPGTISGTEYVDANGDGKLDDDEAPVSGSVTVTLVDGSGKQVIGTDGHPIPPVTTTTGSYSFATVPPGTGYTVIFTDPSGDVFTNPSTGTSGALTVTTGTTTTQDAGVTPATYGVGDFVFQDENDNGIQDPGEPGLNGVTVQLFNAEGTAATSPDGTVLPSTVTADGPDGRPGYYQLGCVLAGTYSVKFTLPANTPPYGFTTQGAGTDPTIDSNPDPASGVAAFTLGVGDANLTPAGTSDNPCTGGIDRTIDAGVIVPTTVSGSLVTTSGAPEGNIQVSLVYASGPNAGTQVPGQLTSTSTADGSYSFTGVTPGGPYEVVFGALPTGVVYQSPPNGTTAPFSVTSGTPVTGEDGVVTAGVPTFGVGDTVFNDLDGSGIQVAGDPGVAGTTVELIDNTTKAQADDVFGNPVPVATTDASGHYSLGCVVAGSYTVVFTPPAGSGDVFSEQEVGNNPAVDSNPDPATGQATVELDATDANLTTSTTCSGGVDDTIDAGLYQPTTVSGTVATTGGTGLAGITVTLIDPVSKNPILVGGNPVITTTDAQGDYILSAIPPGSYEVTFGPLPTGDSYQSPASGTSTVFTVTSGTPVTAENATVTTPLTYGVGDFVWNDLNGNGVQDPGEPGIPGVSVELIGSGGTQVGPTVTTAADGSYSLGCVPAGTYTVQFTLPAGSTDVPTGTDVGTDRTVDSNTSPTATAGVATTTVTLGASDTNLTTSGPCTGGVDDTIDAGYYQPTSVSGTVLTTSGTAVSGIIATLVNPTSGDPILVGGQEIQATTDSSGDYQLTGVPSGGPFAVSFGALPTGDTYTSPASGVTAGFTVTSGDPVTAEDETVVAPPATYAVGDFVWDDLNHDGIQQPGEPGVNNVTVQLLNPDGSVAKEPNGAPVPSVVTTTANGSAGFYQLGCVEAGSYVVQFTLPGGYQYTVEGAGTNPAVDSNADPTAGASLGQAPVTLSPADTNLSTTAYDPDGCTAGVDPTVDAGIYPIPGTVSGTVKLTGGATLPAGVTVTASVEDPANGDAVVDGPDGQPLTATVAPDGSYSIGEVPPGDYVVGFSGLPAGYSYQTPASGTSAGFDLTPGGTVDESATVNAPVAGDGTVSGTIAVSGAPASVIDGVTVTLEDGTGTEVATATTDANGSYSFTGVVPGTYQVVFGALPDGQTYVTPAGGNSGTFAVTAEETTAEDATVTPVVPGTVAGTVTTTGTSPQPVAGVTVTLEDPSGTAVSGVAPVTTGANGQYSFPDVPPGSYEVGFSAPAGYDLATPVSGSSPAFTVTSAQTTTENATVTSTTGTIDGKLLDAEGDPVLAGVTVTLENGSGQPILVGGKDVTTTTSTTDGSYSFPDLAPGSYEVSFGTLPSGDTYVTPPEGQSGPITVTQGIAVAQNAVVAVPGSINGSLTSQSGQGLAGVTVTLEDSSGTAVSGVAPVTTGANGQYSFPDLPAGTYKVGFGPLPSGDTYVTPPSGTTGALTVTAGAATTADATFEGAAPSAPGSVTGTLKDQSGNGVSGVTVTLEDPNGTTVATTTTAADGSYSFTTVPPGSYQVVFGALPAGDTFVTPASGTTAVFTVSSAATTVTDATVAIPAAAPVSTGTVSGTVTDSGGNPVAGVPVTLENPNGTPALGTNGQPIASTTTGADGTYTFPDVPVGTYVVSFGTPPGGGTYATPASGATPNFTVTSGADTVENAQLAVPSSATAGSGNTSGSSDTGSGTGSNSTALPESVPAGLGPITTPHHDRAAGLALALVLLGLAASAFGLRPRRRRSLR
jgi:hypothetical protein